MQEKPGKIPIILLLAAIFVLIIMNINLSGRVSSLEHVINSIQHNQFHEMRNLQWAISSQMDSMEAQISQLSRMSFDETLSFLGYSSDTLSANIEIGFNLKEFGYYDEVSISARGMGGQIFTAAADRSDTGRFSATMSLPVQDNFVLTFTARGATVTSGSLMEINLVDRLCDRFWFSLGVGVTSTHATYGNRASSIFTFTPHLTNATEGNDLLSFRSVSILALSNGNVVYEWDLMPYLRSDGVSQFIEGSELWEWDRFQLADPEIEDSAITTVRLVMYDNLGIRYEQMESVPFFHTSGMGEIWAVGSGVAFTQSPNRLIRYGEDSWHFVHMVKNDLQ